MRIPLASGTRTAFYLVLIIAACASPTSNIYAGFCGDGIPDPGEECDDGNTASRDGCSANCTIESTYEIIQKQCGINDVINPGGGPFQIGDSMIVTTQIPLPGDLFDSQETENGTVGFFSSPGEVGVSYLQKDREQTTGEAIQKLQGLQDGAIDLLAVGGFGTNLNIGDWDMTSFFAELADESGTALTGVQDWPGTDFDYNAFNTSQCGADFENTVTQETASATGVITGLNSESLATISIDVTRGDTSGLLQAIKFANQRPPHSLTIINLTGPFADFVFFAGGIDGVLGIISRNIQINGAGVFRRDGNASAFPLVTIRNGGSLTLNNDSSSLAKISDFSNDFGGGAIQVYRGKLIVKNWTFSGNSSAFENGGAINALESEVEIQDTTFFNNSAGIAGGALYVESGTTLNVNNSVFSLNKAELGCDIAALDIGKGELPKATVNGTAFTKSDCLNWLVYLDSAEAKMDSIFSGSETQNFLGEFDFSTAELNQSVFSDSGDFPKLSSSQSRPNAHKPPGPQAVCEAGEQSSIVSLGYNIASDDSCGLDQATDLSNTDPLMSEPDEDGIQTPLPGSPAIDSGRSDVMVFEGDTLASLPCGFRDLKGTARPQDANGDGSFECDRGAIEVPGNGDIVAGHSGAFFNPGRNGEGNYVEILDDDTATVYTFTYRQDGSGPAWFVGSGTVSGNSIVVDNLLRPVGTRFGESFNADDINFTPIGGMSMVFPDCLANASPGNVAYSGAPFFGYEGLITKAKRLSDITGCGTLQPSPKAGLSGSFYDPSRNGEGVIVEWLANGTVLVIFFTYDLDGNQMWLLGTGTPVGNSVTIEALYPSAHTQWGQNFDADDVTIDPWGTFTLTWSDCDGVTFEYSSTVAGYGSGTRTYIRLSKLQETSCPDF